MKQVLVAQQVRDANIAANSGPELTLAFGIESQVLEPDENCANELKKYINHIKASPELYLKFVLIDKC